MESPTEKQILNRAYEIWERNGRPEGREDEFWHQAEQELRAEEERGDPAKASPDASIRDHQRPEFPVRRFRIPDRGDADAARPRHQEIRAVASRGFPLLEHLSEA